ncbi:MAG: hypothetical protein HPZ91_08770 [Lentisphaeria bacterium]|nr:hypothetical protein [Lentisphaeria bacterium]
MKVAVVSNPRHRAGDMIEFLLLRAIHTFNKFVPADLLIVEGELGETETGFLSELFRSVKSRKVPLPVIWPARDGGGPLPPAPERIAVNGTEEEPAALVERIRAAAGGFPEFRRAPFEAILAELAADGSIRTERCAMAVPEVPGVGDFHVHTRMAYCSENMDIPKALEMAKLSNVGTVAFTEHSGQLYFEAPDYWSGRYVWRTRGMTGGCPVIRRMEGYEETLRQGARSGRFLHGFELDVDRNGDVALDGADRRLAQVRLGAVHHMAEKYDPHIASRQFLYCTESLLKYGVHILAHPFRIFAWSGLPKAPELFEPVAELLRRYGAAAEINFHQNDPEPEFFELCLKKGVKLSLGSDSHNLYEVGFFLPHFRFLKKLGVAGRLDEVLFQFKENIK